MSLTRPFPDKSLGISSSFKSISSALRSAQTTALTRTRSTSVTDTSNQKLAPREKRLTGLSPCDYEINYDDVDGFNEAIANYPQQKFYAAMHKIAPMPERYHFDPQDILMFIFVVGCAGSGLPLYIIGSSSHEEIIEFFGLEINLYPVGAAYANFLQNALYAYCFAKAARNFQKENKKILAWSVLWGVTTAYVPTAAMFRMGFKKNYTVAATLGLTLATALSTFPLSFFAIYETTIRIIKSFNDNPRARKFLLQQLRNAKHDDPRALSMLKVHDNEFITDLGFYLGIAIGISQVLSIEPWVCDSEKSFAENWGLQVLLSWVLSIAIFNFPNLLIAGTFTGFDQGDLLINLGYSSYLYLSGKETYYATLLESAANTGLFLTGALTLELCLYSSKTSVDMTDECPSAGMFNSLLVENVDWGTIWGNFVMTMFTVAMIFKVNNPIREMRDWINSAPIEEIEQTAEIYFPDRRLEWQRAAPASTSSSLSRLSLLGSNQANASASIHLLTKEEEDAENDEKKEAANSSEGGGEAYSSFGFTPK